MRNWFACVYHSTQSNRVRSIVYILHVYWHFIWIDGPNSIYEFVCCRPTHKQSLYIVDTYSTILFYFTCFFLLILLSFFCAHIDMMELNTVFTHKISWPGMIVWMRQVVRTRFCVFTFLSLDFEYSV